MPLASRPATTRRQWLLWLVLTGASLGGFAAIIAFVSPFTWAHVPLTHHPWVLPLRMQWMPVIGVLGLVAPLLALVALFLRAWRSAALSLIAICASLQFAYVGLERYLSAQERAGAFAKDDPWLQLGGGRRP